MIQNRSHFLPHIVTKVFLVSHNKGRLTTTYHPLQSRCIMLSCHKLEVCTGFIPELQFKEQNVPTRCFPCSD